MKSVTKIHWIFATDSKYIVNCWIYRWIAADDILNYFRIFFPHFIEFDIYMGTCTFRFY